MTHKLTSLVAVLLLYTTSFAADFYWIGATGDWDVPTNWSSVSGGAPGATIPTATDNVIFDANSGFAGGAEIVTMNVAVVVTDFDFSGITDIFELSSALGSIEIQGTLSANALANISWTGDINMNPSILGNSINSNGFIWGNDFHLIGTEGIALGDDFSSVNDFYIDNGGLDAMGFNFSVLSFYSNTVNTRTIDFTNSFVTINGIDWDIDPTTLTFNISPSTIRLINGATVNFIGGNQAYDTLRSSAAILNIYGDNSFTFAELFPSSELAIDNGTTQQVDSLYTSGSCGAPTIINSINPLLTPASIEKTGFLIYNASNLNIDNVDAVIGGGQVYEISLSDTLASINWTFSGTNYYWIGNGGNWNDINHWSFNSGGAVAGCIPGPEDSVYFDAASFALPNDTVFVDLLSYFGYMDWSLATNSPNLKLDTTLQSYGDIILNPNMTVSSVSNGIEIKRTTNITSAAVELECFIRINTIDDQDQLQLQDDLAFANYTGILLLRGELHTNSDSLTAGFIRVFELPTTDLKEIHFYNSFIKLNSGFSAQAVSSEFIFDAGASHVFVGDTSYANFVITDMASMTFWDLTLDYYDAVEDQVISGSNFTYNKLEVLKGSHIIIDSLSIHTINDSLLMIGNCLDSIYLSSSNSGMSCSFNKATSTDVIAECIAFDGIGAGGVSLTAAYSEDVGANNPNWTINTSPPVTANFSSVGPYCFGDTAIFNDLSVVLGGLPNDYTLYWLFDDGSPTYHDFSLDSTGHVFNNGGDFDVSLVAEYSNFCTDTATNQIHINKPNIYLSSSDNNQDICENETVVFEASSTVPGVSFEYFINGVSQNIPSPNDTLLITSTLIDQDSISVVSYENGCPSPNPPSMVFTVKDAPIFSWTSSDADTAICQNDNVDFAALGGAPSDVYRYLINGWVQTSYTSSGLFSTSLLNDQDTVQIVGQNTDICHDTLEMIFTVHPLPSTSLTESTGSNLICDGTDVTFTAAGAVTYEFFVNGISQGAPAGNVWSTNSLSSGQVVSVIGYSSEGCSYTAPETYSYTVNPLPNITISISPNSTTICSGDNVNITTSGGSLYEMYINSVSQGAPAPITSYNLNNLNNNDTVYIEGGFSGCTNQSDSIIFEVLTSPTTNLVSDDPDQSICSQDAVTFTASGATNYEFFINGISQGAPSATNTFVTSGLTNGQTVSVNGESNTCIISQALSFTVLPIPSVSIFSDDADNTICEGELITFTGANANSYELFINGSSQGAPQGSPTFPQILNPGNNSVYIIGTAGNGCSDTSATIIDVTVNATPTVIVTSSDSDNIICEGENVIFTGSGSDMYQFFLNGISQGSLSATDTYINSNLPDGAIITAIGSTLGCTNNSNSINITVNPIPTVALSSSDIDNFFCEGDVVIFTASGATNYEFFVDGQSQGASSPIDNINSTSFSSGNYLIDVIGEANSCTNNSSISVTVYGLPSAGMNSSDIDNIICSGENVTYTATGGSLFEFTVNGVSQGPASPLDNITLSNLANGDVVGVNVTNVTGCDDLFAFAPIVVNPTPTVNLASSDLDLEICAGDIVTFTGSGSINYEFFVNGISQSPSSPSNTLSISNLIDGDIVSLQGSSLGCNANSQDLTFIVYNEPIVALTNNSDLELCSGELTNLIASGGNNYQFLINGVPAGGFTPTSTFNSPLNNGDIVSVIGELNGCQSTAPNTFTYTVYTYPTLSSSVLPSTVVCQDELVTISATGGLLYTFDLNGTTLQNSALNTFDITTLEDGDIIDVTAFNGDCASSTTSYNFTVNSMNLDLNVTASNLICEGENVTFTATGGNQYEFFLNGVSQGPMSATNSFSSSALTDLDQITFNAYSATTGCIQEYGDYTIMNVIEEPIITPLSSTQFCEGDSVVLLSNAPYGNQWFVDGSPIIGATDTSYVVYNTGAYSLDVTGGGDGDIWSFGHNSYGNFGSGTNANSAEPTMAITSQVFDELSSGYHFVLAVTQTGEVYSWGDNEFGQLGDGSYSDENLPIQVPTLSNIKTVATTETSSMAVTNTGDVYVWGNNDEGQLATGNTSVINFPFLNSNLIGVDSIAGGRNHFILLKNDGTVWAVGNNDYGQLGQGNLTGSMDAIQVPGIANVISVGAGEYQSFAIDNAGDLYVWGNNGTGQLGLNDLTNRLDPTLSPLKKVTHAQGGATHSMFLTSDKKVYTSGGNTYGQLGTSNFVNSTVATQVGVTGAVSISAGEYTSLIRRSDNTVYGFGNNMDDQLSSPSGISISTPELIPDVEGVTFIEASQGTSHFIFGDSQTCTSQTVNTNLLTAPPVSIYVNADTLSTDFGSTYQWFLNGNPIPGAINQTYEATTSGNYSVTVTFANGCTSTSIIHVHSMTAIKELSFGEVQLYPNPTDNNINVAFSTVLKGVIDVLILDQTGRLVKSISSENSSHLTLNVSDIENGIYYLHISNGETSGMIRFVKNSK